MDAHQPESSSTGRDSGSVPERNSSGVSPARRRLVKGGAFLPPALLTLRSGAAVAAVSNALCLAHAQQAAKDARDDSPDFAVTQETDDWLRAPVLVREARRVRKKKGKWLFKGRRTVRLYTYDPAGMYTWWSVRRGRSGRKWNYQDAGETIEVADSRDANAVTMGALMYRNRNPRQRYVGVDEGPRYGIVVTDRNGEVVLDEEGKPLIEAIADQNVETQQNISASCWASLHPTARQGG